MNRLTRCGGILSCCLFLLLYVRYNIVRSYNACLIVLQSCEFVVRVFLLSFFPRLHKKFINEFFVTVADAFSDL
jgi:hypothetical protein